MFNKVIVPICTVVFLLCFIVGLIAWLSPVNPNEPGIGWSLRIGATVLGIASLAGIVIFAITPEPHPNFLRDMRGWLGQGGVIFVLEPDRRDNIFWLNVHYQNRFERAARVTFLVQPSKNLLMRRNDVPAFTAEFHVPPAGYGIMRVPMAIRGEYQGKKQSFEVAARIEYPNGQGQMLRKSLGMKIPLLVDLSDARPEPDFRKPLEPPSSRAGKSDAVITYHAPLPATFPARVSVAIPANVREVPDNLPSAQNDIRWTLADAAGSPK